MNASAQGKHSELGVGLTYVPGLEPLLQPGNVDVLEIEPQTLWQVAGSGARSFVFPRRSLDFLASLPQPKLVHGVGDAVGGSRPANPAFVAAFAHAIAALDAPWASEHLSVTRVAAAAGEYHTSFMLPPLQTSAGARVAASTIRQLTAQLAVPFAVEPTVNYLRPRAAELPDGEFVARVVEQADCGILLDLHNLWTNQRNGRQDARAFLASLPLERVWELHFAGGQDLDGYWLDAHSGAVPEPVLELAHEILPRLPHLRALIFEIFPSFLPLFGLDRVQRQLERLRGLWSSRATSQGPAREPAQPPSWVAALHATGAGSDAEDARQWEVALGSLVARNAGEGLLATELQDDPAIALIQKLVWGFRAGTLAKGHGVLLRLLLSYGGSAWLDGLLDEHFRSVPPEPYASDECKNFVRALHALELPVPHLADVIRYEEALVRVEQSGEAEVVPFECDPRQLIDGLLEQRWPLSVESGAFELELRP